jgi:type IV pilus assembly protein PilY1
MPTETKCVNTISGSGTAASMFNAVVPPANGVDGPGTNSTTAGARHNGALTIQLISSSTAATEIELAVTGHPEYGWRVKAANYAARVLAEYTTFWHYPNNICYGVTGWTKAPAPDTSNTKPKTIPTAAAGSTDPKVGSFKATSSVVSVTTTVNGNVTTTVITFADHTTQTITRTKNSDGTLTIYTVNPDGTSSTVTEADTEGTVTSGGDEKGTQAKTGRISWTERRRN